MNKIIKILENTDSISEEIALILNQLAGESNGKNIHIALSGGSTPKAIFKYLTENYGNKLADNRFHFWWGDDRCVPPSHDDSNYKWVNMLWLSPIEIPEENIHRILGENDPENEAKRYSAEIAKNIALVDGIPQFDFVLLGLGEDGHTASIFPHQIELLHTNSLCEVATHPSSSQQRITFTGKLINNARLIVFLATGESKAQKVHEIIDLKDEKLPACHIQSQNGTLIWLLDQAAAAKLDLK